MPLSPSSEQLQLSFNAKELEAKTLLKKDLAIFTEAPLGLLERKVMNVLLLNAQEHIKTHDIYKIRIADLAHVVDFESHNYEYLKKSISTLRDAKIKWNILSEEHGGEHSLISGFVYKKGEIEYSFDPLLKKYFLNEYLTYTKFTLAVQKKFKRSHTIPFYEICQKYFDIKRMEGETPYIDLKDVKRICGIEEGKYKEFKEFNRAVLKPVLKEIDEKSDLSIGSPDLQRVNRKVVSIKLRIKPHEENWMKYNPYFQKKNKDAEPLSDEIPVAEGQIDLEEAIGNKEILKQLASYGILPKKSQELLDQYPAERILNAIQIMKQSVTEIRNPSGFLIKAIEEGDWKAKPSSKEKEDQRREKEVLSMNQKLLELQKVDAEKKKNNEYFQKLSPEEKFELILEKLSEKNSEIYQSLDLETQLAFKKEVMEVILSKWKTIGVILSKVALLLKNM